jgi:hypothetical protein
VISVAGPVLILCAGLASSRWDERVSPALIASNNVIYRIRGRSSERPQFAPKDATASPIFLAAARCHEQSMQRECVLRRQLGSGCEVLVRSPFVIAGDFSREDLAHWYEEIIAPAARAISHSYLRAVPDRPIEILLFSSSERYRYVAEQVLGDHSVPVYGYFRPNANRVVLNAETGPGTLVHELTHALVSFDFPSMPSWFNEGLASLHEECRLVEVPSGPWIEGLPNWRRADLEAALAHGELQPLLTLIDGRFEFRGHDELRNYAQARYLCLYLQHQGVLADFYRRFRDRVEGDPQGVATLREILGGKSWPELDRDFRSWLVALDEPPAMQLAQSSFQR